MYTQPAFASAKPAFNDNSRLQELALHSIECATIDDIENLTDEEISAYIDLLRKEEWMCDMATD